jgi:hypothetical protein
MYCKYVIARILGSSNMGHDQLEPPLKRFVVLWVDRLEVSHVDSLSESLLVEGSNGARIQETTTIG